MLRNKSYWGWGLGYWGSQMQMYKYQISVDFEDVAEEKEKNESETTHEQSLFPGSTFEVYKGIRKESISELCKN